MPEMVRPNDVKSRSLAGGQKPIPQKVDACRWLLMKDMGFIDQQSTRSSTADVLHFDGTP